MEQAASKIVRGGAGVLVVLGMMGWMMSTRSVLADPAQSSVEEQIAKQNAEVLLKGPRKDATIKLAQSLRAQWRPWALLHRKELGRMLAAKADDQKALMAVWNAIPKNPYEAGKGAIDPKNLHSGDSHSVNA